MPDAQFIELNICIYRYIHIWRLCSWCFSCQADEDSKTASLGLEAEALKQARVYSTIVILFVHFHQLTASFQRFEQVACADVLILNKVDLVSEARSYRVAGETNAKDFRWKRRSVGKFQSSFCITAWPYFFSLWCRTFLLFSRKFLVTNRTVIDFFGPHFIRQLSHHDRMQQW